ncbi:MAG: hypothetical protein AVDCRST_MAG39-1603, partial [uncultured Sphingomonadaceae bacterium]
GPESIGAESHRARHDFHRQRGGTNEEPACQLDCQTPRARRADLARAERRARGAATQARAVAAQGQHRGTAAALVRPASL